MMHSTPEILLVGEREGLPDLLGRLSALPAWSDPNGNAAFLLIFPKGWGRGKETGNRFQKDRQEFFASLGSRSEHVGIATVDRILLLTARDRGHKTFETRAALRAYLEEHRLETREALRHFSSERWQAWTQYALSRLRILSSHRLSVWVFLGLSVILFGTILFIALPSARIRIWPKVTLVNHTANVLLTVSGATVEQDRQFVLPLLPVRTEVSLTITFDQISKNFLGENAKVTMTLINETDEQYIFRTGTRLVNQAGMIFRTKDSATVPAASFAGPGSVTVEAEANPEDLYGQIVGERGNVPEGLKWEIPGLTLEERAAIYARNLEPASGGLTKYGTLLQQSDLDLARKQLEQELLKAAKARTEEEIELLKARTGQYYVVLQYDVLTGISFSGGSLPLHLVGQSVTSLPIEGGLRYTILAYSKDDLLNLLLPGLMDHIEEGHELVEGSVFREGIAVFVVEYDDNLQWVKVTAELTGKQRAALSASSPAGRTFADKVRDAIRGKTIQEAERIIQNFPEVDRVAVSVWPPWQYSLPSLASNIFLLPQED